jgi:hypothetical protein
MKHLLYLLPLLLIGCSKEEIEIQPRISADLVFSTQTPCIWETLTVTFDNGYFNNCGTSKIEIYLDSTWVLLKQATPVNGIIQVNYIPSYLGTLKFRGVFQKKGGCKEPNTKVTEEISVGNDCCQNQFIAQNICNSDICQYGVEFFLRVDHDVYAIMTGTLQGGDLCGFYDENNNLVVPMSGSEFYIEGDLYGCQLNHFFVYYNSPVPIGTSWAVRFDGETLSTNLQPCQY